MSRSSSHGLLFAGHLVCGVLIVLARPARADTVTWDGNTDGDGDNTSWTDAMNWDADNVPQPGDDVEITITNVHVLLDTDATVASLTFSSSNGNPISSLTVAGVNTTLDVTGAMAHGFGNLLGNGTIMVGGTFTQVGSNGTAIDTTVIANGLDITAGQQQLSGTLINNGAAVMRGNNVFRISNGTGTLINNGTFDPGNADIVAINGGGSFVNGATGMFTQTDPGTTTVGVLFVNADMGVVNVMFGTLDLDGGAQGLGSYTGADGTTIVFGGPTQLPGSVIADAVRFVGDATIDGDYDVSDLTEILGNGTDVVFNAATNIGTALSIDASGGSATFNIDVTPVTLTVGAGNVAGTGIITVSGQFTLLGGLGTDIGGTVVADGDLDITTQGQQISGTLISNVAATMRGNNVVRISNGTGTLINNGTFDPGDADIVAINGGGFFVNSATGSFTKTDPGTTLVGALFTNVGALAIQNGTLQFNDGFNQTGGATTLDGGSLAAGLIVLNGGSLSGVGTVSADVSNNAGIVRPGLSPGMLTIAGDYTQDAGAVFAVEIGGIVQGVDYDWLDVTGTATLDGYLSIDTVGGFVPDDTDMFDVLTATSVVPGFASTNCRGSFMVSYDATTVTLNSMGELCSLLGDPNEFEAAGEPTKEDTGNLDPGSPLGPPGNTTEDVVVVIPDEDPAQNGSIQVFLNNGTDGGGDWLGLTSNPPIEVGREPTAATVDYLDADTDLDVAVTNGLDDTLELLFNDGSALFPTTQTYATGPNPSDVATGEYSGDAILDIIVSNQDDGTIWIYQGNGDGTYTQTSQLLTGENDTLAVDPSDLDNDKDADVAALNGNYVLEGPGIGSVSVFRNLGGGSFTAPDTYTVGSHPTDLAVADVDADGFPDIIVTNHADDTISVLSNNGDGTFDAAQTVMIGIATAPRSVDAADFDLDTDIDLAIAADDPVLGPSVQVLENLNMVPGVLAFNAPVGFGVGADPNFLVTADMNASAPADVITVNADDGPTGGSVTVLLGLAAIACPSDFDGSGDTGITDFLDLLAAWGPCPGCPEDLDGDGVVGITDFLMLLASWGPCVP